MGMYKLLLALLLIATTAEAQPLKKLTRKFVTTGGDIDSTCSNTNLMSATEALDNGTYWTQFESGIGANETLITDPLGGNTAETFTESTSSAPHRLGYTAGVTVADGQVCFSIYVRLGTRSRVMISVTDNTTGNATGLFNLSTQTATVDTRITQGSWTGVTANIQHITGSWYRCIVAGTKNAGTTLYPSIYMVDDSDEYNYTGVAVKNVYLWGAQMVTGPYPCTYDSN